MAGPIGGERDISIGLQCNGTFLQHRSLENRVYAYDLEGGGSIMVKLYRPGSWSRAAIAEEHLFLSELRAAGLDVACPLKAQDGSTIGEYAGILYAIFENIDGKSWLQEEHGVEDCRLLGRLLASIHEVIQVSAIIQMGIWVTILETDDSGAG